MNRNFNFWNNLYKNDILNINYFIYGLITKDHYYLLNNNEELTTLEELEDSYDGFIEKDFKSLMTMDKDDEKRVFIYDKIALSITFNLNIGKYLKLDKKIVREIIDETVIYGKYEKFGIKPEVLIRKIFELNIYENKDIVDVAILRGFNHKDIENKLTIKDQLIRLALKKYVK